MSTVRSTFVIPDYGPTQTLIDPQTGMAEGYTPASFGPLASLLAAGSDKPQKEHQKTTTKPLAYDDILKRRNTLAGLQRDFDDAMKARESTVYSLAKALAAIPQQQGYGSWLTDFARSFGGAMTNPMNMYVDRAKTNYTNAINAAKLGLDFDKALGSTTSTDYSYTAPGVGSQSFLASLFGA